MKELSNWLKSLKGRVQPKQEWSGEDEKFLEMDSYIKKYSSLKKIGLTNLNMAEIYYKCKTASNF